MHDESALQTYLDRLARTQLGHLPTPIEPMERLSADLGGPALYVKRDDLTGLGFGGNKIRALEYILPEAMSRGADVLVTAGVVQSNSTRQIAAAAARLGVGCHVLVITDRVESIGDDYSVTGNALLGHLFGATTETMSLQDDREQRLADAADHLRAEGFAPYVVPYGCSNLLGATGYVNAALEITQQSEALGLSFTHVVHASGTGGTQAGLIAGFGVLGRETRVIGIDVDADPAGVHDRVATRLAELTGALGVESFCDRIAVDPGYAAGAYGAVDKSTIEAIGMAARLEALLVDPVYSGKGFAGLIGLARSGHFGADDRVLFIHTGGEPALFAYHSLI